MPYVISPTSKSSPPSCDSCQLLLANIDPVDDMIDNKTMTGIRMDKWLWAARFFKTRSMAARACELGRVSAHGQSVKAARDVHAGDRLRVKNESGEFEIEVLALSDIRGPAPVAQTLYRETEESREQRLKLAEARKAMPRFETDRQGRPSGRDRRRTDRLRGR